MHQVLGQVAEARGEGTVLLLALGQLLAGPDLGGHVDDLRDEVLELVVGTTQGADRQGAPDRAPVGSAVLLGDAVGGRPAGAHVLGGLQILLMGIAQGQVPPGLGAQGLGVVAEEVAHRLVDHLEAALRADQGHAGRGAVHQPAVAGVGLGLPVTGLGRRLLRRHPFGDIDDLRDVPLHRAVRGAEATDGEVPPARVAVGMDVLLGRPVGVDVPGRDLLDLGCVGVQVVGMGQFLPGLGAQGGGVVAEEGAECLIDDFEGAVGVDEAHPDIGVLHQSAEAGVGSDLVYSGLSEEVLIDDDRVDHLKRSHHAVVVSAGIIGRLGVQPDPVRRAVARDDPCPGEDGLAAAEDSEPLGGRGPLFGMDDFPDLPADPVLRRGAENRLRRRRDPCETPVPNVTDHVGDVLGEQSEPLLGLSESGARLMTVGDVPPGEDDVAAGGRIGPGVVPQRGAEDLVVVEDVVDDDRCAGVRAAPVKVQQGGTLQIRRDLQHPFADQILRSQTEVGAGREVDVAVAEVDRPSGVVADRFHQHHGIEQRVHGRAQQCGRLLASGQGSGPVRFVVEHPDPAGEFAAADRVGDDPHMRR